MPGLGSLARAARTWPARWCLYVLVTLACLLTPDLSSAQQTERWVSGVVTDSVTGHPLAFAEVAIAA